MKMSLEGFRITFHFKALPGLVKVILKKHESEMESSLAHITVGR